MVILIQRPLVLRGGAGAYQTHVPLQNVQKLGELVQAGLADELADAGLFRAVRQNPVADDPGIPVQLEHEPAGDPVLLHILLLDLIGVGDHAAELIHLEDLAVAADALLGIENRAGGGSADGRADKQSQHSRNQAAHQAADNIQHPLHRRGAEADAVAVHRQNVVAPQILHGLHAAAHEVSYIVQTEMHRDAHGGHGVGQLQNRLVRSKQYQHLVHPVFPDPVLRPGPVRHNGKPALRPLGQRRGQDQPRHAVSAVHALFDLFVQLGNVLRPGNNQQRAAVSGDDVLFIVPLVQATGTVADDKIKGHRIEEILSGIEAAHLHHKEDQRLHREDHGGIAHRRAEFGEKSPLLYIVHGVAQHNGHKVHQRHTQQQHHILRASRQIEIRGDIYIVSRHHGQHHGEHIQQNKIPVLGPGQPRSLIHLFSSRQKGTKSHNQGYYTKAGTQLQPVKTPCITFRRLEIL